jgi:hypothetical protein
VRFDGIFCKEGAVFFAGFAEKFAFYSLFTSMEVWGLGNTFSGTSL